MSGVKEEEALSLMQFHDPIKNTLWYIAHTEDRESIMTSHGCRIDLSPDPSGRWKLMWIAQDEIYKSVFLVAPEFDEAREIWERIVSIANTYALKVCSFLNGGLPHIIDSAVTLDMAMVEKLEANLEHSV